MYRKLFIHRKRWFSGIYPTLSPLTIFKIKGCNCCIIFLICLPNKHWKLFSMCHLVFVIFLFFFHKKKSIINWPVLYNAQASGNWQIFIHQRRPKVSSLTPYETDWFSRTERICMWTDIFLKSSPHIITCVNETLGNTTNHQNKSDKNSISQRKNKYNI